MTESIERELELDAVPARVWRSLTDAELLAEWLADEATLELRPGGDAWFRIGERTRTGWIEEVSPPPPPDDASRAPEDPFARDDEGREDPFTRDDEGRDCARLTFWWAEDGEPASRVELALVDTGRGTTLLRIVETRPLEILDLVGLPLPGHGGAQRGPALVAA